MIVIGELSLWVALLMAAWAATVSFAGGALARRDMIESGERAIYATLGMLVLAAAGLWTALFTHDFRVAYVASLTSANLPKIYTFSAFWAGRAGTLLLWALLLSMCASIAVYLNRARDRTMMPYASGTLAALMLLVLVMMCFGTNPFERLDWTPLDGRGMNPDLQHPAMAIHPPSLYLGYAATTIPFAFAIAAIIRRSIDREWLTAIRSWSFVAWFFTTTGILLGLWWSYVERGGGTYWAWNPVENGSVLPWRALTAFLYLVIMRNDRSIPHRWTLTLVASAFLFSMFATFISRNGIVSSTRASAQLPVESWVAAVLVLAMIVTIFLLTARLSHTETTAILDAAIKTPRRYGIYTIFAGLLVMFAGFGGLAFAKHFDLALRPGDAKALADPFGHTWNFVSQGISQYDILNRQVTALTLDLSRDGKRRGVLTTEKRQHIDSRGAPTFDPSTEAGIRQALKQDVYVSLASVGDDQVARIRIAFNPLVTLVWVGGAIMTLGGLILMWPYGEGTNS